MNILIITPYFYPENFRINDFAVEYKKKGHKVSVLTPIPNYPDGKFYGGYGIIKRKREYWNGIYIYRSLLIPRGTGTNMMLGISWISSVIGNLFTSLFILKNKFDLIFVFGPSPILICLPAIVIKKIKRIPICFWVLDLWPESVSSAGKLETKIIPKLLMPLIKFIYYYCDKILVSSPGFIDSISEKNIDKDKIHFFPQWAEPIFKRVENTQVKLSVVPKNSFIVMFAGNIGESQDFDSILMAATKLKENKKIHWVIVGSGRKESELIKNIKKFGISDTFHLVGRYPLDQMPSYYSLADVMLISLKKEYIFSLTIPAKLQSYLACGKPIMAMIDGVTSQLVRDAKAGLTCNSEDVDQLAANVLNMSTMSADEINKMGINAYNLYLHKFNRETLLNKLEQLFYKMIRN